MLFDVPVTCINHAAVTYHIPATAIIAVLKTEGGKIGMASKNKNGTFDYGPMQINSTWLPKLQRMGYSQQQIQNDACTNIKIGTWILAQKIAAGKDWWHGIGGYNSYTPQFNQIYSRKVQRNYERFAKLM